MKKQNVFVVKKKKKREHKKTHCKTKIKITKTVNNYVKVTNVDKSAGRNIRKFVQVKIINKNIKLQLDSKSEKIGKPRLIVTRKIPLSVTGQKINLTGNLKQMWCWMRKC